MKRFLSGLFSLVLCYSALGQTMTSEEYYRALYGKEPPADPAPKSEAPKILKADEVVWKNHPFLPLQVYDMLGDPAKKDLFMALVKFPSHYTLPAHFHPYDEAITVIKGIYRCQTGTEDFTLKTGESLIVPKNTVHISSAPVEEVVLQLSFIGPPAITFVNPADDPRNAKKKNAQN